MSFLHRLISRTKPPLLTSPLQSSFTLIKPRLFSSTNDNPPPTNTDELWTNKPTDDQPFHWASASPPPPPTQIAAHFDGQTPEAQAEAQAQWEQEWKAHVTEANSEMRWARSYMESWEDRVYEVDCLMEQVREPGFRGDLLLDAEKAEMYNKFKEDPVENSVEKLAKEYRVMRQRVHAILWLKEMEEEEERKRGEPLDDSVEALIDACPELVC